MIDATTLVIALKDQLATAPKQLTTQVKQFYPDILETVLMTALDEEKVSRSNQEPINDYYHKRIIAE